jgi:hypothetical protein
MHLRESQDKLTLSVRVRMRTRMPRQQARSFDLRFDQAEVRRLRSEGADDPWLVYDARVFSRALQVRALTDTICITITVERLAPLNHVAVEQFKATWHRSLERPQDFADEGHRHRTVLNGRPLERDSGFEPSFRRNAVDCIEQLAEERVGHEYLGLIRT